jgi:hypothetical protein
MCIFPPSDDDNPHFGLMALSLRTQNEMEHLPDTISALVNLKRLLASHNRLVDLPPGLFLCQHLKEVGWADSRNAMVRTPDHPR